MKEATRLGITFKMNDDGGYSRSGGPGRKPQNSMERLGWRELIQHAMKEATRLGITFNMNDDGGYSGSGGPWITPEISMQMLSWSETTIDGGKSFAGNLRQPKTVMASIRTTA